MATHKDSRFGPHIHRPRWYMMSTTVQRLHVFTARISNYSIYDETCYNLNSI